MNQAEKDAKVLQLLNTPELQPYIQILNGENIQVAPILNQILENNGLQEWEPLLALALQALKKETAKCINRPPKNLLAKYILHPLGRWLQNAL